MGGGNKSQKSTKNRKMLVVSMFVPRKGTLTDAGDGDGDGEHFGVFLFLTSARNALLASPTRNYLRAACGDDKAACCASARVALRRLRKSYARVRRSPSSQLS